MFPISMIKNASTVLKLCDEQHLTIVTAESCTGGLIAGCLTEVPGSSSVIEGGFITYSNRAKNSVLSVRLEEIEQYGAVSKEVALSMAEGALRRTESDIAIACTGVAGPGGATKAKPAGLVHLACALRNYPPRHKQCNFSGDRSKIRLATVDAALKLIKVQLGIT